MKDKEIREGKYGLDVVTIRMVKEPSWYSEEPLENGEDVARFLSKEFLVYDREIIGVLNMASDGKVINMNIASVGAVDGAVVTPREIFKSSILSNASWIILFHNHPSGRLEPSNDDKLITQRVREAGLILGIELKDHVIIGNREGNYYSFYQAGILEKNFRDEYVRNQYDIDR